MSFHNCTSVDCSVPESRRSGIVASILSKGGIRGDGTDDDERMILGRDGILFDSQVIRNALDSSHGMNYC